MAAVYREEAPMSNRGFEDRRRPMALLQGESLGGDVPCGVCGSPASETVTIELMDRQLEKDLCDQHLADLLRGEWLPPARHLNLIPGLPKRDPGQSTTF
jgi:hypothetical protein